MAKQDDENRKTIGSQSEDAKTRSAAETDQSRPAEASATPQKASSGKAPRPENDARPSTDGKPREASNTGGDTKQTIVEWTAANIPAYELAIQRGNASFEQVAEVHFGSKKAFNNNDPLRLKLEPLLKPIHEAFEKAYGTVTNLYWCSEIVAGVAITSPDQGTSKSTDQTFRERLGQWALGAWRRLSSLLWGPGYQPKSNQLFSLHIVNREVAGEDVDILTGLCECERQAIQARTNLQGEDARVSMQRLYSSAVNLLMLLNKRIALRNGDGAANDGQVVDFQKEYLADTERFIDRSAQRDSYSWYFIGMLFGAVLLILLTVVVVCTVNAANNAVIGKNLLASFVAGAVGAFVSVMSRMTAGKLRLRYESGNGQIFRFGVFRPVIGAIFGAVVYAVFTSDILPLDMPSDSSQATLELSQHALLMFYCVVGFLAGFTERWAQDVLTSASSTLLPASTNGSRNSARNG